MRSFDPLLRLRRTKIYRPGMYKSLPNRVNWDQFETRVWCAQTEKRRSYGILEGSQMKRKDGRKSAILREAESVADEYIRSALLTPRRRPELHPAVFAAAGTLLAGGVWLVLHLMHVI